MLGLVGTTTFVAMREKKARTAAIKKMTPPPASSGTSDAMNNSMDGFGEQDPLDSFGSEVAAFDEDAFK